MPEITKEQFAKFVKLQQLGTINMTDIVKGSKLINESEDTYEDILFNFTELKKKFK